MVVQKHTDPPCGRIARIEAAQKDHELAAAMALREIVINVTRDQVHRSIEGHGAQPFVFMIPLNCWMPARLRRPVRGGGGKRLQSWLLIIGQDRGPINLDHRRQALIEGRITPLQVVADLVRPNLLLLENGRDRA